MKKYNRRERRIYKEGKNAGYYEGYRQGLEDGNPFNQIIKAARALTDGLAKAVNDPAFIAALEKAKEMNAENRDELLGHDNDLIVLDEIDPEKSEPWKNETF